MVKYGYVKKAHQTSKMANQGPQGCPTIPYDRSMCLHHPAGAYMCAFRIPTLTSNRMSADVAVHMFVCQLLNTFCKSSLQVHGDLGMLARSSYMYTIQSTRYISPQRLQHRPPFSGSETMSRTVPWDDSCSQDEVKLSYRVVVHEPKNRSRESLVLQ